MTVVGNGLESWIGWQEGLLQFDSTKLATYNHNSTTELQTTLYNDKTFWWMAKTFDDSFSQNGTAGTIGFLQLNWHFSRIRMASTLGSDEPKIRRQKNIRLRNYHVLNIPRRSARQIWRNPKRTQNPLSKQRCRKLRAFSPYPQTTDAQDNHGKNRSG